MVGALEHREKMGLFLKFARRKKRQGGLTRAARSDRVHAYYCVHFQKLIYQPSIAHQDILSRIMHKCTVCDYKSDKISNFKRHMEAHERKSTKLIASGLMCPHCSATFTNKSNCTRHINDRCLQKSVSNTNTQVIPNDTPDLHTNAPYIPNTTPDLQDTTPKSSHVCKCGKTYTRKEKLNAHIPKCTGVANTLQCPGCLMMLSSYNAKSRHIKKCTVQRPIDVPVANANPPSVVNNNTNNGNIFNIQELTVYLPAPQGVLPFGKENTSYLTDNYLFTQCLNLLGDGVLNVVGSIFINDEHPENWNVSFGKDPHDTKRRCNVVRENGIERACTDTITSDMVKVVTLRLGDLLLRLKGLYISNPHLDTNARRSKIDKIDELVRHLSVYTGCEVQTQKLRSTKQKIKDRLSDAMQGKFEPVHPLISKHASEIQKPLEALMLDY